MEVLLISKLSEAEAQLAVLVPTCAQYLVIVGKEERVLIAKADLLDDGVDLNLCWLSNGSTLRQANAQLSTRIASPHKDLAH